MKKILSAVFAALILAGSSYAISDLQACFNQFDAGNYQLAVQYGKKAVREYPNNPNSYFCLGKAYTRTGQINKAIENLKKASQYTSNDRHLMWIYNWLGVEYNEKGNHSNALFYESKSLKLAERFGDIDAEKDDLNNIASIFQDEGNDSKALEYYKKVLELENGKSRTGTIYNNIASIYSDMHNYKKAIEYLKKAINVDEEHGHYLESGKDMLNLGAVYIMIKDFKDAKLYLEKGLKMVKKVGNKEWEGAGYKYLGWYYKDVGNKVLAKKYFMKALNIFRAIGDDRNASRVVKDLSSSYATSDLQACVNQFKAGNYQKAVQYGKEAVREYPNNPISYSCLGIAYAKIGQIYKAIENLKKASEYTSNDKDLMYIYGWLGNEYKEKGDYSNALFYYSKSLKLAEKLGDVSLELGDLNNIAIIFKDKGDYSKALEYYKKVLDSQNGKSQSGKIYNNIAFIYENMNNYKKAVEYFKKAMNVAEEHGYYLDSCISMLNLGNAYRHIKDFKDAKFYLEEGLKRVKKAGNKYWEGRGYGYLGFYYQDIGNKVSEKEYFMKALDIFKTIGDSSDYSVVLHALSSIK